MKIQYISAVDVGSGSAVLPCTMPVPDRVFQEAGIPLFEEIYFANYVKVCGSKYKVGNVVVLSFDNDMPTFGAILHIMHASGKKTFVVQKKFTVTYSSHYHAYEVVGIDDMAAVGYLELADWHPLNLHAGFGQNVKFQYVVPRYELLIKMIFFCCTVIFNVDPFILEHGKLENLLVVSVSKVLVWFPICLYI
jgi:hypothetical protein